MDTRFLLIVTITNDFTESVCIYTCLIIRYISCRERDTYMCAVHCAIGGGGGIPEPDGGNARTAAESNVDLASDGFADPIASRNGFAPHLDAKSI